MCDFLSNNWQELLPAVITATGIVVGILTVRKQLKEQADRQSAQARDELFVKIYDSFSEEILVCQERVGGISTEILMCPGGIRFYWLQKNEFGLRRPTPISYRSKAILTRSSEADRALIRIISVIERYEIVFRNQRLFQAFKSALLMQSRSRSEAFGAFYEAVVRFLPIDVPEEEQHALGTAVIEPRTPTEDDYAKLDELADVHLNECTQIVGCLIDLLHEAQNNLLGHLFQRQLPPRIPRKESCLSVRDDEAILANIEKRAREWEEQFNPEKNGE